MLVDDRGLKLKASEGILFSRKFLTCSFNAAGERRRLKTPDKRNTRKIFVDRNAGPTVSSDMVLRLVKVDMKGERRRGSLARTVARPGRRNEGRRFSPSGRTTPVYIL